MLAEISTRRIRNSLYGGVGQRLHTALLQDAKRLGVLFLYLYPLNEQIATLYQRPEWGYSYISSRQDLEYMFLPIRGLPPDELLDSWMPTPREEVVKQARNLTGRDVSLRKLLDTATPRLLSSKRDVRQLEDELTIMDGLEPSEKRAGLREFLKSILE